MKLKLYLPILTMLYAWGTYTAVAKPAYMKSGITSLKSGKIYSGLSCDLCVLGVKLVEVSLKLHLSRKFIGNKLLDICEDFHVEDKTVCLGLDRVFMDELLTVLEGTSLSASDTCVLMFGSVCSSSAYDPEVEWAVQFPDKSKPTSQHTHPQKGAPKMRILQLSDIHVDTLYTPGTNTDCGEPICCHASDGKPKVPGDGAGYWGDYRPCDIPEHTLDNLFTHLSKNEKFDVIYWTGDLPPHNIWNQTRESQVTLLERLTRKLLAYFPKTPIFSAIGNHESFPVDSFPPPYIRGNHSESWLYNVLAKTWSHWLPQSATATVKFGAFYTTLIKPGFRIVSINTNYCDHMNWWLILNVTDPAHELHWLIQVLQAAEDKQEKVHIVGHIPPGNSGCYRVWSMNYGKIVVRYAGTIAAQFFGHTHFDHLELFYNRSTMKPVSVAYIAPSVTTFVEGYGMNPGYRVYEVDGMYTNSSWTVLDHETTILNLTLANTKNITTWEREYSAKSAYNMSDLSPQSWHAFTHQLQTNDTAFEMFLSHYYKMKPPKCDATCRETMICALRMATYGDKTYCSKSNT